MVDYVSIFCIYIGLGYSYGQCVSVIADMGDDGGYSMSL